MNTLLTLARKSLWNRRATAILTAGSIAVSVALLFTVEKIRITSKEAFENTISDVDLLVGARTGGVQLLLYSVFRMGNATNNVSWESYQQFKSHPEVKWTIPMSLGDSHYGFRVLGTSPEYFDLYRFGRRRSLQLSEGKKFSDVFDAVIGADIAKELGYDVGRKIILSHGVEQVSFQSHDDKPFTIVGILEKTGTPVDRTVHVSLAGIEAIHADWQDGAPPRPGESLSTEAVRKMDLTPKSITAFLIKLNSRIGIFSVRKEINEYRKEALLAVVPGLTLQELWDTVSVAEKALVLISFAVVFGGLFGMMTMLLAALNERRREMAILRSVGARSLHIFLMLLLEAEILVISGCLGGLTIVYLGIFSIRSWVQTNFGMYLPISAPSSYEFMLLGLLVVAGGFVGVVPAWRAYQNSVGDGLSIRV